MCGRSQPDTVFIFKHLNMHEKLDFARIPAPLKPLVQRGYEGEADAPLQTVIAGCLWPVPGTAFHPSPAVSQGQVCARCPLLLPALPLSIPAPRPRCCPPGLAARGRQHRGLAAGACGTSSSTSPCPRSLFIPGVSAGSTQHRGGPGARAAC